MAQMKSDSCWILDQDECLLAVPNASLTGLIGLVGSVSAATELIPS
jgi:hypothetical protein